LYVFFKHLGGTDFTAWLYPIAVTAFWAGLSFRKPSSDANGVLYLCINVFLVFAGQFLDRFLYDSQPYAIGLIRYANYKQNLA